MNRASVVFKAMSMGIPVKLKIFSNSEEEKKCFLVEGILHYEGYYSDGVEECLDALYGIPDYTLSAFIKACDRISDKDFFLINGEIVLNKYKKGGNSLREVSGERG